MRPGGTTPERRTGRRRPAARRRRSAPRGVVVGARPGSRSGGQAPRKTNAPGHLSQHEREVLRRRSPGAALTERSGPNSRRDRRGRELRLGGVVDGDRVPMLEPASDRQPVRGRDALDHAPPPPSRPASGAAGENERTVASKRASSGMMLSAVPAWKLPTVITTGSKTSNAARHHASAARSPSRSAAGIGSRARCGRSRGRRARAPSRSSTSARGHERPGPGRRTRRAAAAPRHVQAVGGDGPRARGVEHALLDHVARRRRGPPRRAGT